MTSIFKLDIPRDVQIAKWGLGLLTVAFGTVFMYLISEFKDVRKDISGVQATVAAQTATTAAMQTTLGRIEDKVDQIHDDAQASQGTGQTEPVHQGAGGGAGKP